MTVLVVTGTSAVILKAGQRTDPVGPLGPHEGILIGDQGSGICLALLEGVGKDRENAPCG